MCYFSTERPFLSNGVAASSFSTQEVMMRQFCGSEVQQVRLRLAPNKKEPPEGRLTRLLKWLSEVTARWYLRLCDIKINPRR